ncbi:hypothetical protein OHB12_09130 [Nocardia sp. NBC_01730]|uniref:hypothetical protein n=1 Tax=Nocardia sp. NBC_01730 TaxID=2975998 RepID=UPI002E156D2C|nr:hypothetical protein OHB12_09130 [Nocardia sp. NBC_01730]
MSSLAQDSWLFWSRTWDTAFRPPRALLVRCRDWANSTLTRRIAVRLLVSAQVLLVVWTAAGGVAAGGTDTVTRGGNMSAIDGLAWTGVQDSSGIRLSDYMFATDGGSLLAPQDTALSMVLGLEFTVFMVIVISAIWLIGFVVSFRWLDWLGKPLNDVANALTDQVATPIIFAVAASIGAFFVAVFVVRGYHAKAVLQVVVMLAVAVLGATYLAHPLAEVLSSNGLVVKGRDVGIAIAAGLNGNSTPDARSIVGELNGTLADNFARHPLQVWNFGHVIDDSPMCRAAWSSGVAAGSDAQVARAMRDCGDSYAHAKIENPSMGQVGTGLVLMVFGTILLLFMSYLAIKIFLAALSSVFHALMAIFGFAAGGFIYGPTQGVLMRNLVGMVGDAASMVAYTIFLGCYALVLDSVFRAAPGSGMAVIFVGGMLLIAGFVLLRRLDLNLIGGQSQLTGQIRAALAGNPAPAGGGGATPGIGEASLRYTLSPGHLALTGMRWLNDLSAINASPITSWVFRRPMPLTYFSKGQQDMNYLNYRLLLGEVPPETAESWMGRLTAGKNAHDASARAAVAEFGGLNHRAAAAAVTNVLHLGGDRGDALGAIKVAGFSEEMATGAIQANVRMVAAAEENPVTYDPLSRAAAALELAHTARGFRPSERDAYIAQFAESASLFHLLSPRPLYRDNRNVDQTFVRKVQRHWDESWEGFKDAVPVGEWGSVNDDTRRYIGSGLARDLHQAALRYSKDPSDQNIADAMRIKNRAVNIDMILSNTHAGPWTN